MLEDVWMKGALNKLIRSTEEFYKDPEHEKEFHCAGYGRTFSAFGCSAT